jgi:hypothetical protein
MTVDSLAKRILPKIEDHPEGDLCRWSVYDFTFEAPKAFRLEKQSLKSGHLSITLKDKLRRLVVERYGPASVLLKRDRLADWATAVKPIFVLLKPFNYRKAMLKDGAEHEAIRLTGRRKSVKDIAARVALWFIRRQASDALDARIWKCEASNRVYVVLAESTPREVEGLAERVVETIPCHADEPDSD